MLREKHLFTQEMSRFEEPDILFNMLNCLKILCLHGECLYIARKDHPQFLAYIQDHMLIARWVIIAHFVFILYWFSRYTFLLVSKNLQVCYGKLTRVVEKCGKIKKPV